MSVAALVARVRNAEGSQWADCLQSALAEWAQRRPRLVVTASAVEAMASLVSAARKRGGKGARGGTAWLAAARHYCTAVRACAGDDAVWEQAALQAVTGSVVRLVEWQGDACADEAVRCLARLLAGRGHLLGKELLDGVVALVLPRAAAVTGIPVAQRDDQAALDEDARDGGGDGDGVNGGVVAAAASYAVCSAALLCLAAMLAKAKRKSYCVDTHLGALARVALTNVRLLAPQCAYHRGAQRAMASDLALLEAVVNCGSVALPLYQVEPLLSALVPLLYVPVAAGPPHSAADGVSSATDDTEADMEAGGGALGPVDRMRVHVLLVVTSFANNCYKSLVEQLSLLLPYGATKRAVGSSAARAPSRSLHALLLYDTCPRVRLHALLLLTAVLKPGKRFFAAAQETAAPLQQPPPSQQQQTFVSLSLKLALVLRDIHATVSVALHTEDNETNRVHLHRLVPVLVSVTPYHRLASSTLLPAVVGEHPRLPLDRRVEDDVLLLLPTLRHLQQCWNLPTLHAVLRAQRDRVAEIAYWLWRDCLGKALHTALVKRADADTVVLCLYEVALRYPEALDGPMREDGLLECLLALPGETPLQCILEYANARAPDAATWLRVLALALPRAAAPSGALVALLSGVPASAWGDLPAPVQLTVVATVTGAFDDDDAEVRIASVRGVGRLLMVPDLVASNVRFLVDAKALLHRSLRVRDDEALRTSAFWGLGNLADALVAMWQHHEAPVDEDDLRAMMVDVFQGVSDELTAPLVGDSEQQEKVTCACLRVMAKAALLLSAQELEPHVVACVTRMVACLRNAKERPKVRWNAAKAVALFCGPLSHAVVAEPLRASLAASLVLLLQQSGNFKERTSALAALDEAHLLPWADWVLALVQAGLVAPEGPRALSDAFEQRLTAALRAALALPSSTEERVRVRAAVDALCRDNLYHVHQVAALVGDDHAAAVWLLDADALQRERRNKE